MYVRSNACTSYNTARRQNRDTFEQVFESGRSDRYGSTMAKTSEPGKRTANPANVSEIPDGPPDAAGLTPRQRKVLEVISESVERRGYPPSMREIGEAVGLTSTSSVAHQLSSLERKGFLRRDANRPRAVEVRVPASVPDDPTGEGDDRPTPAYVPVVGRIAAATGRRRRFVPASGGR
jgi:hypothetical protein